MSPAEIQKSMDALRKEFLPSDSWTHASIYGGQASITAYVRSGDKRVAEGCADDWPEAFEKFRSALIAWGVERNLGLVRKLALAIVDLTDVGVCDLGSLMKAGFTADEISRHGGAACELAAKMTSVEAYHIHSDKAAAE